MPHKISEHGKQVAAFHQKLKTRTEQVEWIDMGAGAESGIKNKRMASLGKIARGSGRRYREGELLYRICKHYQPQRCLEFGTNLGISALYQMGALEDARFVSMEGAEVFVEYAQQHFEKFNLKPEVITGDFNQILDNFDLKSFSPDYVLLDGNHRYEATMQYFHRLMPNIAKGGIMIFDDINWSQDMQRAWQEIQQHPDVSLSIDLFQFGICFIRQARAKEHFHLSFWPLVGF